VAQKLKSRPENEMYDDGKPGWRTDIQDLEDVYNAPPATDEHLPEGHPSRKKKSTPDELNEAEQNADSPGNDGASSKEGDKLKNAEDAGEGGWETSVGNGKRKSLVGKLFGSRRSKIGWGIAAVGTTGVLAFSSFLGPNLIINQLRELLLTKASQLQSRHSLKYRRRYINKIGDMLTKDGRRGGKIIAEMESRGYRFRYDNSRGPNRGKMIAIIPPGDGRGIPSYAIADHLNDYLEIRHPFRTSKWKTKRMEAFYNRYKVTRSAVTIRAPTDPEDPEVAVNKKVAGDVFGDDIETRVAPQSGNNEETDEEKQARETKNSEHATVGSDNGAYDEIKKKLRDGVPISELTAEEQALLRLSNNIDDELVELIQNSVVSGGFIGKATSTFLSLFNTADLADKLCTVQNRLRGIQTASRTYRALGMLRYASTFIKAADATRASGTAGRVDPGMFNVLMKRVTAVDANGNGLGASPGMAYIIKGKFSKSKNDAFKGNYAVDGKLTGFPAAIKDSTDLPGINRGTCRVAQNPVFQVGLSAIEIGVGIFTGGSSAAASSTVKTTFTQALKAGIRSMMTKKLARNVAVGVFAELSFEGGMALVQMYADKSLAVPFTTQERGGELGDALAGGSGTLNKQRSLQAGMVPATTDQYEQAHDAFLAEKNQERRNQSLFAKVFDYSNTDSLAFQAATNFAMSPASGGNGLSSMASSVMSAPSSVFSNIFRPFVGRVHAEDEIDFETYEVGGKSLATDPAGNVLPIMRSDIEDIDPEINIQELIASGDIDSQTLDPKSEAFTEHVKNCVEGVDIYTVLEKEDQNNPKFDCLAQQPLTKKFKAHLAYIDMVDGVDAVLFPEEINSTNATTSNTTNVTPSSNNGGGIVGDIGESSESVSCAPGTNDIGVVNSEYIGEAKKTPGVLKIRLCQLTSIGGVGHNANGDILTNGAVTNSRTSGAWQALGEQAKKDGIELYATSSFRLRQTCSGGPDVCAPSGRSYHQLGVAMDFMRYIGEIYGSPQSCGAGRARDESSAHWRWLHDNAERYGIKQFSNEAWHWDPANLPNRCGTNQ
jgi:hypothetical protein